MKNEIKPTYVTFEQAKWLKEIGIIPPFYKENYFIKSNSELMINMKAETFDSDIHIYAPEQHQAIEWLRINHGIWVTVDVDCRDFFDTNLLFFFRICDIKENLKCIYLCTEKYYDSPQAAYSEAFDYILNNNLI